MMLDEPHQEAYDDLIVLATSLNNLAVFYFYQGRNREAEPLYQQALELRKRLQGDNHSDVATSRNFLAVLYQVTGRYKEAEQLYVQALKIRSLCLWCKQSPYCQCP